MKGFLILCDYAEEINGKLYITGGGWSRVARANIPSDYYVAGKILVQWTETNRPHVLKLLLKTGDGHDVMQNGDPVQLAAKLEVGRPPGLPEGTELDLPLALKVQGVVLQEGRYRWELTIDEELVTDLTFDVLSTPDMSVRM